MQRTATRLTAATAGAALAVPSALLLLASPASADSAGATVSILHGVPGATVDVYVNGDLLLDDFAPGTLTDPQQLPAGTHEVAILPGDAADASADPIIGPADITVEAGGNYTVVAHLDADGNPTATPFGNDTSRVGAGEGRVTVRHVAAAPEVSVSADGNELIASLANPDEAVTAVPAATYAVEVAPASGGDAVLTADLPVTEGANTIVYAWGSLEDDNLDVAVQTIEGLHSAPGGVPAGEGGLAAGSTPVWALGAMAAAALTALLAVRRLARR
jgi:hypothetical protein